MSHLIGVVVGVVLGCGVGVIKNVFVWDGYLRKQKENRDSVKEQRSIMKRSIVSYFVCLGILLVIYLLRNVLPFDWIWCLVATGISISLMNIALALRQKLRLNNEK